LYISALLRAVPLSFPTRRSSDLFGSGVPLQNDFFLGFDGDRDGDFSLSRAVADGISSDGVIAEPVEDEDDAALGGSHLLSERPEIIQLHGDQRPDELAGTLLDRDRNLGAIPADAALVRGAVLAKSGRSENEETQESGKNLKARKSAQGILLHHASRLKAVYLS